MNSRTKFRTFFMHHPVLLTTRWKNENKTSGQTIQQYCANVTQQYANVNWLLVLRLKIALCCFDKVISNNKSCCSITLCAVLKYCWALPDLQFNSIKCSEQSQSNSKPTMRLFTADYHLELYLLVHVAVKFTSFKIVSTKLTVICWPN